MSPAPDRDERRSEEVGVLLLEEHRRSHDVLRDRYRTAEEFLTWIIRTSIIVFAAFATAGSIANARVLRMATPFSSALFAGAITANFAAFAYAVDSLSVSGVEEWIGRERIDDVPSMKVRWWLIDEYRRRLQGLQTDVDSLEESGQTAVLLLYLGIALFLGGGSLLAVEAVV